MQIRQKNSQITPSPEYVAEQLLIQLKVNQPEDLFYLEELAIRRNALVVYEELKGSEARLAMVRDRAIITVSDAILDSGRKRFSIAHELGHWELHRHQRAFSICQNHDLNEWSTHVSTANLESEANLFAAAFLLPKRFFRPLCLDSDPSLRVTSQLASSFRTSLTATTLRYIHFSPEPCCAVYSRNMRVAWAIPNQAFKDLGFYVETKVKVDESSLAHKVLQSKTNRREGRVPLECWAIPGRHARNASVREESWYLSSYDSVLTLLWFDDSDND